MFTNVREYGSEFDWKSTVPYIESKPTSHYIKNSLAYGLRSGRDALKAVAQKYSKTHDTVLLPVLCCESMVTPFSMNGYKTRFYKLKKDLTADEKDVEEKLTDTTVLVYMSYFGIEPFSKQSLEGFKEKFNEVKFVEDRTHNPLHGEVKNSFLPDAVVISIRKWLAVADGGLLFVKDGINDSFSVERSFSDLRKMAMEKKSEFLKTGDKETKNEFRKLLNEAAELLDISPNPCKMTEASADLISKIDYEKILLQRQENVQTLKVGLQSLADKGKISFITNFPERSTLYFPVLVKNRDDVQGCLAAKSVYCPVIWPLPQEAINICSNSEYIAGNMLAIPCDQRYNQKDMLEIIEIIKSVI